MEYIIMGNKNEKEILEKLVSDIATYNKIFLILNHNQLKNEWLIIDSFLERIRNKNQTILILSGFKIPICITPFITCRQITKEEEDYLKHLYYMYEFSDRFFILSKEHQYGQLFNFVDTGLLKPEEVWEVLVS